MHQSLSHVSVDSINSPECGRSLSSHPLVVAGVDPLPGLPLPGGHQPRVGVGLGGGEEDDGVVGLLLPLHHTAGQAAHGHPVGSPREVHLTEEIEQILQRKTSQRYSKTNQISYSVSSGLLEGSVFEDDLVSSLLVRTNFRHCGVSLCLL